MTEDNRKPGCRKQAPASCFRGPIEWLARFLHQTRSNSEPLLLTATRRNSPFLTAMLLAAGADVNQQSGINAATALHYSCANGRLEVTRTLLGHGAAPNAKDRSGMTPLHLACAYGRHDIVEELLSHHADPNARDTEGVTPLMDAAATSGAGAIVKLLIEHGADRRVRDKYGRAAVDFALTSGNPSVVRLLGQRSIRRRRSG